MNSFSKKPESLNLFNRSASKLSAIIIIIEPNFEMSILPFTMTKRIIMLKIIFKRTCAFWFLNKIATLPVLHSLIRENRVALGWDWEDVRRRKVKRLGSDIRREIGSLVCNLLSLRWQMSLVDNKQKVWSYNLWTRHSSSEIISKKHWKPLCGNWI